MLLSYGIFKVRIMCDGSPALIGKKYIFWCVANIQNILCQHLCLKLYYPTLTKKTKVQE